jgi:hypothetical protein
MMSQIPPTLGSQNTPLPAPPAPPPPPPQPPAGGTSSLSAEAQQKIAAIYAEAQTAHTPAAQVQQQVNVVIEESQPAARASSNGDQVNLFDATA